MTTKKKRMMRFKTFFLLAVGIAMFQSFYLEVIANSQKRKNKTCAENTCMVFTQNHLLVIFSSFALHPLSQSLKFLIPVSLSLSLSVSFPTYTHTLSLFLSLCCFCFSEDAWRALTNTNTRYWVSYLF